MDEQELPGPIGDLTLRSAQPTTPSISALYEPTPRAHMGTTDTASPTASEPTGHGQHLDYNGANGPGGVSRAAPVAALPPLTPAPPPAPDSIEAMATPLIPDQPLPPGAPASLAAAMNPSGAELSPPSTGLSTPAPHEPSAWAHKGSNVDAPLTSPAAGLDQSRAAEARENQRSGRSHPFKPSSPPQIAEFAQMWYDPGFTNDQITRRYRTTERTIQRWREEFGLPDRPTAFKERNTADTIVGAASTAISGLTQGAAVNAAIAKSLAPAGGQTLQGVVVDPTKFNPLADPEIVAALDDIRSEARMMTAHSDLQVLQRKIMRLTVVATTKMPTQTWGGLTLMAEALQRAVLNARRIEADIPGSAADPVLLRKEAAGQMMRELKSVLTPAEQQVLANLVKAGADRLMAKGGDHASITAGVEGGA